MLPWIIGAVILGATLFAVALLYLFGYSYKKIEEEQDKTYQDDQ